MKSRCLYELVCLWITVIRNNTEVTELNNGTNNVYKSVYQKYLQHRTTFTFIVIDK